MSVLERAVRGVLDDVQYGDILTGASAKDVANYSLHYQALPGADANAVPLRDVEAYLSKEFLEGPLLDEILSFVGVDPSAAPETPVTKLEFQRAMHLVSRALDAAHASVFEVGAEGSLEDLPAGEGADAGADAAADAGADEADAGAPGPNGAGGGAHPSSGGATAAPSRSLSVARRRGSRRAAHQALGELSAAAGLGLGADGPGLSASLSGLGDEPRAFAPPGRPLVTTQAPGAAAINARTGLPPTVGDLLDAAQAAPPSDDEADAEAAAAAEAAVAAAAAGPGPGPGPASPSAAASAASFSRGQWDATHAPSWWDALAEERRKGEREAQERQEEEEEGGGAEPGAAETPAGVARSRLRPRPRPRSRQAALASPRSPGGALDPAADPANAFSAQEFAAYAAALAAAADARRAADADAYGSVRAAGTRPGVRPGARGVSRSPPVGSPLGSGVLEPAAAAAAAAAAAGGAAPGAPAAPAGALSSGLPAPCASSSSAALFPAPPAAGSSSSSAAFPPSASASAALLPSASASASSVPGSGRAVPPAAPPPPLPTPPSVHAWPPLTPAERSRCDALYASRGYASRGGATARAAGRLMVLSGASPDATERALGLVREATHCGFLLDARAFALLVRLLHAEAAGYWLPNGLSEDQARRLLGEPAVAPEPGWAKLVGDRIAAHEARTGGPRGKEWKNKGAVGRLARAPDADADDEDEAPPPPPGRRRSDETDESEEKLGRAVGKLKIAEQDAEQEPELVARRKAPAMPKLALPNAAGDGAAGAGAAGAGAALAAAAVSAASPAASPSVPSALPSGETTMASATERSATTLTPAATERSAASPRVGGASDAPRSAASPRTGGAGASFRSAASPPPGAARASGSPGPSAHLTAAHTAAARIASGIALVRPGEGSPSAAGPGASPSGDAPAGSGAPPHRSRLPDHSWGFESPADAAWGVGSSATVEALRNRSSDRLQALGPRAAMASVPGSRKGSESGSPVKGRSGTWADEVARAGAHEAPGAGVPVPSVASSPAHEAPGAGVPVPSVASSPAPSSSGVGTEASLAPASPKASAPSSAPSSPSPLPSGARAPTHRRRLTLNEHLARGLAEASAPSTLRRDSHGSASSAEVAGGARSGPGSGRAEAPTGAARSGAGSGRAEAPSPSSFGSRRAAGPVLISTGATPPPPESSVSPREGGAGDAAVAPSRAPRSPGGSSAASSSSRVGGAASSSGSRARARTGGALAPTRAASDALAAPVGNARASELARNEARREAGLVDLNNPAAYLRSTHSRLEVTLHSARFPYRKAMDHPFATVTLREASGRLAELPHDTHPGIVRPGSHVVVEFDQALRLLTQPRYIAPGSVLFFEIRHWKAAKRKFSTAVWTYLPLDKVIATGALVTRVLAGPWILPLYHKPVELDVRLGRPVARDAHLIVGIRGVGG